MNKSFNILSARNLFFATLLIVAVVLMFLAPRAAVNVDEQLHYPHAKKVVNWYFSLGNDRSCLDTPLTNLKYYGQSVDNFTALLNRIFKIENEFLIRHLTGAFFYWILLVFAGFIGHEISGSYWVSVLTVLSLVFMPRLFGQAFGNLKDIPFAAGYLAGILFIIRFIKELPKPKWATAIFLALAIAFTCSVRIGGLILFAYLGLFLLIYFILKPFELKHIVSTRPCFVRLLGQGVVILLIGYFAGLLFWPFALQNVFKNPFESLHLMEHYKVSIHQIFNGHFFWSTQLPWYYLPKWILISTPEFIFLGIIIYIFISIKKAINTSTEFSQQALYESILLFAFLFPVIYVIAIKSNLYSGVRQMLFVFPSLAILASYGIHSFFVQFRKQNFARIVTGLFLILMLFPLKHQASTFPADYIYFNSVSGGNKSAWGNFEYDYYFHGIKNPAEYLVHSLEKAENVVVATNCSLDNYFENSKNITCKYVRYLERSSSDWDYAIFGINYIHPFLLKNKTWQSTEIIKTYYHKGNPVVVILKRKNKNDFNGIEEINKGELAAGTLLLKQALDEDPQNVWLLVNLAKASLLEKNTADFEYWISKARLIYPDYEPLFLLEAQKLFDENKLEEAKSKLDVLANINSLYEPATPLLKAINKKLNNNY